MALSTLLFHGIMQSPGFYRDSFVSGLVQRASRSCGKDGGRHQRYGFDPIHSFLPVWELGFVHLER
jgi:hypothetical protein